MPPVTPSQRRLHSIRRGKVDIHGRWHQVSRDLAMATANSTRRTALPADAQGNVMWRTGDSRHRVFYGEGKTSAN